MPGGTAEHGWVEFCRSSSRRGAVGSRRGGQAAALCRAPGDGIARNRALQTPWRGAGAARRRGARRLIVEAHPARLASKPASACATEQTTAPFTADIPHRRAVIIARSVSAGLLRFSRTTSKCVSADPCPNATDDRFGKTATQRLVKFVENPHSNGCERSISLAKLSWWPISAPSNSFASKNGSAV